MVNPWVKISDCSFSVCYVSIRTFEYSNKIQRTVIMTIGIIVMMMMMILIILYNTADYAADNCLY